MCANYGIPNQFELRSGMLAFNATKIKFEIGALIMKLYPTELMQWSHDPLPPQVKRSEQARIKPLAKPSMEPYGEGSGCLHPELPLTKVSTR